MSSLRITVRRLLLVSIVALLAACGGPVDEDLLVYIDEVKGRPGGRIEALPQIKPYENFKYAAETQRSPFQPDRPNAPSNATRPMETRSACGLCKTGRDSSTHATWAAAPAC
jgi:Tfp pilus assembly protein PilP